jgi:hypothetical protein
VKMYICVHVEFGAQKHVYCIEILLFEILVCKLVQFFVHFMTIFSSSTKPFLKGRERREFIAMLCKNQTKPLTWCNILQCAPLWAKLHLHQWHNQYPITKHIANTSYFQALRYRKQPCGWPWFL